MNMSSATGRTPVGASGAATSVAPTGSTDNGRLGNRRIYDAQLAKLVRQPGSDAINTPALAVGYIFAHHYHALIAGHFLMKHLVDGFAYRYLAHADSPR